MTTYSHAPDVRRIGEPLIAKHHTHLADVRVEYVYRSKHSKTAGRAVYGKARKVSGLIAFLAVNSQAPVDADPGDEFFVIEIAADLWLTLSAKERKALVDHELCHCRADFDEDKDQIVLSIRGHDVEEFTEIIERHGVWHDDLKEFAAAAKAQLELFDDDEAA